MLLRRIGITAIVVCTVGISVGGCRQEGDANGPGPEPSEVVAAAAPPQAPDIFADWLRFEPPEVRGTPSFRKFYIDAMLGHQVFRVPPKGVPRYIARALLLDDDKLLLSSGRRMWNRKLEYQIGLSGEFCYIHSTYCLRNIVEASFSIDDTPVVVYDNQYGISRFPSHTTVEYQLGGVGIAENKFITYDDRIVASYQARSLDKKRHTLGIEAIVPYPRLPGGGTDQPSFPLLGGSRYQGNLLFLYLDAPGFRRSNDHIIHLSRDLVLPADGTPQPASLALRVELSERGQPATPLPSLIQHASEYNRWFVENIPYFDSSDIAFKKMWYYRWWIVRFHMVDLSDGSTPDLKDYAFYEGKLGFDNPIVFAIPAQLKELTYLRDPKYVISQLRNAYRNRADNGAIVDPPGSPYWGETYSHWTVQAAAELHRVHPIPKDVLEDLLPLMAGDVRAWMSAYDTDGDSLPERSRPRVTGYDLDILSWWYWAGTKLDQRAPPPAMERVDFASFVYGNAIGLVELATAAGDEDLATEFREIAARIRQAAVEHLWDDETGFFYPQRASDNERAPIRELHGLFPFTSLLAPNEARFTRALEYLVDPQEFWSRFPPVIVSQVHYRDWTWERDGLTRNIAPHPISMGGRTLIQAIRNYDQKAVRPAHVMRLLERYNDLVYPGVHPNDPTWRPNAHEYYSQWEPFAREPRPKASDISHDFHSMWLSLVIEGPLGLVPRGDNILEINPMAKNWKYFLVDGLRYRGHDLTIAWDKPGDGPPRYEGFPEGLSIRVDGNQVAQRRKIGRLLVDLEALTTPPVS